MEVLMHSVIHFENFRCIKCGSYTSGDYTLNNVVPPSGINSTNCMEVYCSECKRNNFFSVNIDISGPRVGVSLSRDKSHLKISVTKLIKDKYPFVGIDMEVNACFDDIEPPVGLSKEEADELCRAFADIINE